MSYILKILVLFLILPGISKAATPFTYLSCKQIIADNKSTHKAFIKERYLNIGRYTGHIFYKFKDLKKKTTFTVHEQGNMVDRDWKQNKPSKTQNRKSAYDKGEAIYSFGEEIKGAISVGYAVQNMNGKYFQTMFLKAKIEDSIDGLHLIMDSECENIDKKKYISLIKTGIN